MAHRKSREEYLAQLGLDEEASEDDIKRVYKTKARECHPDKNQDDPKATEKFQNLSEAYTRLMEDPDDEDDEEYSGFYEEDEDLIDLLNFFQFMRSGSRPFRQRFFGGGARIIITPYGIMIEDDEPYSYGFSGHCRYRQGGGGGSYRLPKYDRPTGSRRYNEKSREFDSYRWKPEKSDKSKKKKAKKDTNAPKQVQPKKLTKKQQLAEQRRKEQEMEVIREEIEQRQAEEEEKEKKRQQKLKEKEELKLKEAAKIKTYQKSTENDVDEEMKARLRESERKKEERDKILHAENSKKAKRKKKKKAKEAVKELNNNEDNCADANHQEMYPSKSEPLFEPSQFEKKLSYVKPKVKPDPNVLVLRTVENKKSKPIYKAREFYNTSHKVRSNDGEAYKNSFHLGSSSGAIRRNREGYFEGSSSSTTAPMQTKSFGDSDGWSNAHHKKRGQREEYCPPSRATAPKPLTVPAPTPPSNIWADRADFYQSAVPSTQMEEEAMLAAALKMSQLQLEQDELRDKMRAEEEMEIIRRKEEEEQKARQERARLDSERRVAALMEACMGPNPDESLHKPNPALYAPPPPHDMLPSHGGFSDKAPSPVQFGFPAPPVVPDKGLQFGSKEPAKQPNLVNHALPKKREGTPDSTSSSSDTADRSGYGRGFGAQPPRHSGYPRPSHSAYRASPTGTVRNRFYQPRHNQPSGFPNNPRMPGPGRGFPRHRNGSDGNHYDRRSSDDSGSVSNDAYDAGRFPKRSDDARRYYSNGNDSGRHSSHSNDGGRYRSNDNNAGRYQRGGYSGRGGQNRFAGPRSHDSHASGFSKPHAERPAHQAPRGQPPARSDSEEDWDSEVRGEQATSQAFKSVNSISSEHSAKASSSRLSAVDPAVISAGVLIDQDEEYESSYSDSYESSSDVEIDAHENAVKVPPPGLSDDFAPSRPRSSAASPEQPAAKSSSPSPAKKTSPLPGASSSSSASSQQSNSAQPAFQNMFGYSNTYQMYPGYPTMMPIFPPMYPTAAPANTAPTAKSIESTTDTTSPPSNDNSPRGQPPVPGVMPGVFPMWPGFPAMVPMVNPMFPACQQVPGVNPEQANEQ